MTVPLISIAYGRSGDKGDVANIGIIARHPDWYDFLRTVLSEETVSKYMAHLCKGMTPALIASTLLC